MDTTQDMETPQEPIQPSPVEQTPAQPATHPNRALVLLIAGVFLTIIAVGAYAAGRMSVQNEPNVSGPVTTPSPTNPTIDAPWPTSEPGINAPTDLHTTFQERISELSQQKNIIPIEGWSAGALQTLLPGLIDADFAHVETMQGHYAYTNGQLTFVAHGEPAHSGGDALSSTGFATLLQNVASRLNIQLDGAAAVDQIIGHIQ